MSALGEAEQASIAVLARRLRRTPHSLYYHVKLLERAGVVRLADTRRRGRRDERIWMLAGGRILLDAHYQGTAGVLKTTVVWAVMAALYLSSGSIWPSIVLHPAIDLQAGAIAFEVFCRGRHGERGQEPVLLERGS